MQENKKIDEHQMLARLQVGGELLRPLVVKGVRFRPQCGADALLELTIPGELEVFSFVLESKSRSTPEAVLAASAQARRYAEDRLWPMIQVPFLSPEKLQELEADAMSGVDLCGNGIVIIPGRLYMVRSGQPNQYRDSRPLANPYLGRSAMVARMLLMQPQWATLSSLTNSIAALGQSISISQVSKAIAALTDDLIVTRHYGKIVLSDPLRLMDKLKNAWRKPVFTKRQAFRAEGSKAWQMRLSVNERLKWAVTGESSVGRYATFSQGGPIQVAVNDLSLAQSLLQGAPEAVTSFAEIELVETIEEAYFFASDVSDGHVRYSNRIQTWLELCHGDARQQDAARDIREQIIAEVRTWQST